MGRVDAAKVGAVLLIAVLAGCGDDDASARDAGADAAAADSGSRDAGKRDASDTSTRDASAPRDAGQDASVAISIRFKAVVGQEDFTCGKTYAQVGTTKLAATPMDFRFFVQDIRLIQRGGEEVDFEIPAQPPFQGENVALIDFTDGEGECIGDPATNLEIRGRVPAGDYEGIVFSNGVPENLNHLNIVTAAPPLQNTGLYWGWQNGYRFLLAQLDRVGGVDDDAGADDAGVASSSSLIHTGSAGCAGSNRGGFTCSRPNRNRVRLTGFDPTKRAIVADLGAVFANSDLRLGKQCHGAESGCDGVFDALGVAIDTGAPLAKQSVFRPE